MPIKFPRMHIAESVLNRIMNAVEGDTPLGIVSPQEAPTPPPDPSALGVQIEDTTATPVPEVAVPEEPEEFDVAAGAVDGMSPFEGLAAGTLNGF